MRALCYLEWRYALHTIGAIRRSPGRFVLWTLYLLFLAFILFSRAFRAGHGAANATGIAPNVATGIAGLYVASFGVMFGIAAAGRIATFRSPAEALLMSNAGLAPLTIALWLQLRRLVSSPWRLVGSFAYLFAIFAPHRADLVATARAFVAAMLVIAVPLCAELPAFLIARGRLGNPTRALAWTIVACGLGFGIVGFAGGQTRKAVVGLTHIDPGAIVTAIYANDPKAIAVPLVLFAAFVAIVAVLGGDAIPELYAAAQSRMAQGRMQRGTVALRPRIDTFRPPTRRNAVHGDGSAHVPPGALALVWKDWLTFRRGSGSKLLLGGAAFWALCGAVAAYETARSADISPLATVFVGAAFGVTLWAPSTAANGLADDLAKPLFWFAHAPLRTRLAAWTLGRAWRGGTALALGPIAAAFVAGHALLACATLPMTLVAYWSLQALGIGLHAVFPSPLDARGPIVVLRLLATAAYLAPATLAAIAAIALHGGTLVATSVFGLALGIEGWVTFELAAMRFEGYGASLGTLTRAA